MALLVKFSNSCASDVKHNNISNSYKTLFQGRHKILVCAVPGKYNIRRIERTQGYKTFAPAMYRTQVIMTALNLDSTVGIVLSQHI